MSEKPLQGFIDECEREQLHLTRFIQPFGLLLAGTAGDARIRHVSANAAEWLGRQPHALLGQPLMDLLPGFPPGAETTPKARGWMYPSPDKQLFAALVSAPAGLLDGWLSCNENNWLLELEPALPESQRLAAYRPIPHRLFRMPSSESEWTRYGQFLTDNLRDATCFERVMVYRFRDDESGEVIAESLEPGLEPYLGLRYPASDIPRIARELYLANSHRQIPDRQAEPVAILSEAKPSADGSPSLDLSLSDLRAASPVHLEYLKNMGVTASLSFSIVVGERLWGLVACHHHQPLNLPLPLRERCVAMCQAFSLAISGYQGARRVQELSASEEDITQLHEAMRQAEEDYARGYETTTTPALGNLLLELVAASGAALLDGNSLTSFGETPSPAAIRDQVEWLMAQSCEPIFATDHLPELFPPARSYAQRASGLLSVRVKHFGNVGERLFLWWRPEQPQTVTWAGDPRKSALSDQGQQRLSPRASFEHWVETMTGCSEPWSTSDMLRARKFRSLLLRDINADLLSP